MSEKLINYEEIIGRISIDYEDCYAGAYIDNEGILNINFKNIIPDISIYNCIRIKCHIVNYSLNYLQNIINILTKNILTLEISQLELDEKNNKIYIYMEKLVSTKIERVKNLIDPFAVEFKEKRLTPEFDS